MRTSAEGLTSDEVSGHPGEDVVSNGSRLVARNGTTLDPIGRAF